MSFTHYPRLEDCPCYGGFACRGGDGACKSLARQQAAAGEEHSACHAGAKLCRAPAIWVFLNLEQLTKITG